LSTENEQLRKLNSIVVNAVEEERLLSQKLYEFEDMNPPFTSKMADSVAAFGGSWKFIIFFLLFMVIWMIINIPCCRNLLILFLSFF
jgi:uncharacterized membrane protein